MDDSDWLADRFEEHRTHLRAVAYRMLGSFADADDALQDAWVRVSRASAGQVDNLGGWLTTIVARVCLNMLRSRNLRRSEPLEVHLPDPVVSPEGELQPEAEALLADSVGLALQIVLDTLTPSERLAFVLHDMFELPFEEIAPMIGRTPAAAISKPSSPCSIPTSCYELISAPGAPQRPRSSTARQPLRDRPASGQVPWPCCIRRS
jgi:RNA polymerase sigma-70 factor (ECF subfamily)